MSGKYVIRINMLSRTDEKREREIYLVVIPNQIIHRHRKDIFIASKPNPDNPEVKSKVYFEIQKRPTFGLAFKNFTQFFAEKIKLKRNIPGNFENKRIAQKMEMKKNVEYLF